MIFFLGCLRCDHPVSPNSEYCYKHRIERLEDILDELPNAVANSIHREVYGNNGYRFVAGTVREIIDEKLSENT